MDVQNYLQPLKDKNKKKVYLVAISSSPTDVSSSLLPARAKSSFFINFCEQYTKQLQNLLKILVRNKTISVISYHFLYCVVCIGWMDFL